MKSKGKQIKLAEEKSKQEKEGQEVNVKVCVLKP
jgi:hypothetical protein